MFLSGRPIARTGFGGPDQGFEAFGGAPERLAHETAATPASGLKELVAGYERHLILTALHAASGNQRRAAQSLHILPTTLFEKMKRLGIQNPLPRGKR